ncbi:MAG: hypothetical protein HUK22_00095, partial [Thermoguttaceae bacterium]|nr:hypothetical protein [Thermoguttaceae bacterium]
CGEKTALVWKAFGRWASSGRRANVEELTQMREARKLRFAILGEFEFSPLIDLSEFFDSPIPTVGERLRSGFDLVLCDGAQLVGGPSCGLVFGARETIAAISQTRTAALTPIGRVESAALSKTIAISESRELALESIPALRILSTPTANLENRAKRLAALLETTAAVERAEVVEGRSALCASANFGTSATRLVEIRPRGFSPAELAERLKNSSPRLLVRWTRDAALIDVKTVAPEQDLVVHDVFEKLSRPAVGEA